MYIFFSCSTHSENGIYDNRAVGNWDISTSTKNAYDIFEAHISKGKEYEENGNIEDAIMEYLYCYQMVTGLEYGYYFMHQRGEYKTNINLLLLALYERQNNYEKSLEIIYEVIRETPSVENYLIRSRVYENLGQKEMSKYDKIMATKLERVYYVSPTGNDSQNDGRTEQSAFGTLRRAIEVAKKGTIKTIMIVDGLAHIEDSSYWRDTSFSINNDGQEILIIGKHSATLLAARSYSDTIVVNASGNFRFANIKISGGNTGIIINSGSNVVFDIGVVIEDSKGSGTGILNNGNLVIQGDAKIINNSTSSINCAGGITNNGTVLLKDNVVVSDNNSIQNREGDRGNGGGILNNGRLTIQDNVSISNNSAISGGGIYNNGIINILGGEIVRNTSSTNGGGILINGGTLIMRSGIIKNNESEYGAGVYITRGSSTSFSLINGRIENNNAKYVGGGIYIENNSRYVQSGGEVINNTAGDGDGNNVFWQ
jgi:hypothetical protein